MKFRVGNDVSILKTENMIKCCLVRAVTHGRGRDRSVWSNGRMTVIKGKGNKL
jgi:hypothetical protein